MKYELKRFSYTIQKSKRDDIMKDISRTNTLLQDILSDQDRISQEDDYALGLTRRTVPRQYKKLLGFWKHADQIYRLMQSAWRCTCAPSHRVYLRLDQCTAREDEDIGLDMLVKFCHDGTSQGPRPWDTFPLSVTYSQVRRSHPLGVRDDLSPVAHDIGVSSSTAASSAVIPALPDSLNATNVDLCLLAEKSMTMLPGDHICTLVDATSNETYAISRGFTPDDFDDSSHAYSLDDILRNRYPVKLFLRDRLSLAYNIAHAFFKLCDTPWLDERSLSATIYLPVSSDGRTLLNGKVFLLSNFQHAQNREPHTGMLCLLGILLLELCSNKPLEQSPAWQEYQSIPHGMTDPDFRRIFAMLRVREFEYEWSSEASQAIDWCLRSDLSQDDSWREAFARNVLCPLRSMCTIAGLGVDGRSDVFHHQ